MDVVVDVVVVGSAVVVALMVVVVVVVGFYITIIIIVVVLSLAFRFYPLNYSVNDNNMILQLIIHFIHDYQ